jgi:hypothetical protein
MDQNERMRLILALVLKANGIKTPNKELAQQVVKAQLIVDTLASGRVPTEGVISKLS